MRDTRRSNDYFEAFLVDIEVGIKETQEALDAGNFTTPSERVNVAQRIYQLAIMRAVAHYSYGAHLGDVKRYTEAILPYRKQLTHYCDKLPANHQIYRYAFEKLGGQIDAVGSPNINRYIYTLWWLALLQACDVAQAHIQEVLDVIGERGKDTLLDNIAIALGDTDRPISPTLYYPEIYQNLSLALTVPSEQQPDLLNQFAQNWYSKLEGLADWHDNHNCEWEFEYTDYYIGYWCFELALVANVLEIPRESLEDSGYVPVDLLR
ncbi:PoNe immunity protein domain-containing protein [Pseudoalteromonas galatheae]|uniref:PoNe immunity protein domain-containing protein n=1 Tax=Pseudoalteromonas galatheae TaxID=579562 RepID=UPI0030D1AA38